MELNLLNLHRMSQLQVELVEPEAGKLGKLLAQCWL